MVSSARVNVGGAILRAACRRRRWVTRVLLHMRLLVKWNRRIGLWQRDCDGRLDQRRRRGGIRLRLPEMDGRQRRRRLLAG